MWIIFGVVLLVVVMVANQSEEEIPPAVVPTPTVLPLASPTPFLPTPTPSPSPTPTLIPEPPPSPTPTPTPTLIPVPTRRPRRATAEWPDCVSFSWLITPNTPFLGHNLVEIEVVNRCDRDLETDDLWFNVAGWRDGGLVQTARAKPFDRALRGRTVSLALDLPGSVDWYDDIRVTLVGR